MKLLDRINGPADLQQFSNKELDNLAVEIRELLVTTVAKNGGHLAPNLGVVELTLALHLVFATPKDKIIWDVGHQSYVHKIITGRRESFSTLRQYKGLSGFPKLAESSHDSFNTGHSSTSVSAALGMALARDFRGEKYHVVAVIGDGALTGGMAFEALNHAGHLGTDLIVVLNDNEMSIANNVGALSGYLTRIRTDPKYFKGKEELENLIRKLPAIGPRVVKLAEKIKDSVKHLVVPGMLFEELGFTYLGPIDGHNFSAIKAVLTNAKATKGPILIHVITKKGKGYRPAEENPDLFHGVGPFDIATGKPIKRDEPPTYTSVFGETITKLAAKYPEIVAITAAMPGGTGLALLMKEYPHRVIDVGIAEQHAVTLAASMALAGLRPVVAIYSTFLQRAFDQVLHDVCMQKLPVVFAVDRAGIVGEDGETHHGLFDLSYLRMMPNIAIMAPKDEDELQHMLHTAVYYRRPVAVRYPRGVGQGVKMKQDLDLLPWGKSEVLREGGDLVIFAVGPLVYQALAASAIAASNGLSVAVVNLRFVKPFDEQMILTYSSKCKRVITLEDNVIAGGAGSGILELLAKNGIQAEVLNLGINDIFVEHGSCQTLQQKLGLLAESIAQQIRMMIRYKQPTA
ncbi:MAG: 1-deoxy-D-xylulose-5-phosphate synthase [Bacillota bacterium]